MSLMAAAMLLWTGLQQTPWCFRATVTGYVRGEGNVRTFDGTSVYTDEPIAAASWNIPLGSMVVVEDAGVFRVADRGRLGPGHIDILVDTRAEALALTSTRNVCVFPPGF